MSGGSFDYLCEESDGLRGEHLRRMASELNALGFPDIAAATRSFVFQPSDELRRVWRAVEWWHSNDSSRADAVRAAMEWREREPVSVVADCDGWLCRCGRFISGMEFASAGYARAREALRR